ncbi:MAG: sugar phosphate isomerase/epimerase family protein [Armatimonadota bacterium]
MNRDIHEFMRIGIIHFMVYPETMKGEGPILETIKKIATDDYFDVIELTWIKDADVRKKVKLLLDAARMDVAYGGQPRLLTTGLNINDIDENGRQRAVATLKEGIDEAYEMGAEGFAFLSGKYQEDKKDEAFDALIKSTRELCDYSASKGDMRIVHEVFDYAIDKKSLVGPASLAARYAEIICRDHSNFGLMVDLSHIPLLGETSEESILPVQDYLVHTHIGNCVMADPSMPCYGDAHPRFGFPGSENDVNELCDFLKTLMNIGFLNEDDRPIVSFEIKPFGEEDPEAIIAGAKRTLNRAWALV